MKKVLFFLVVLIGLNPLFCQSNTIIDQVLGQDLVAFDNAVYLILSAGDKIDENISPKEALLELEKLNWSIDIKQAEDTINLFDASLLIMNSLELKGGLMYKLFPIKRYAFKEMVFNGLLENAKDGNREISGLELLTILGKSLAFKEVQ